MRDALIAASGSVVVINEAELAFVSMRALVVETSEVVNALFAPDFTAFKLVVLGDC